MKTITVPYKTNRPAIPYPNAATRRQVLQKVLDTLVITASGIGLSAALLLMMTL